MYKSQITRLSEKRTWVLGALVVALLALLPLTAAAAGISGDAAYDPAAGSYPELFVAGPASSFSGDDAYDFAAGGYPDLVINTAFVDFSGDDAYDPAAGGLSELAGNDLISLAFCQVPSLEEVGSYSGDDAYDPAVVGITEILPIC